MRRHALLIAVAVVALFALAQPARADEPAAASAAWGEGVQVMDDAEMSDLRGGIRLPGGVDVNFGAVITTYSDGVPALQTLLTWTDTGAFVTQTLGSLGQSLDSLTPEQRTAMGLDSLAGLSGVVIADANGVTALAHNVSEGSLQNIIINNATGRDLSQTVEVTLQIPNFDATQNAFDLQRFSLRIDADMRAQLTGH
jgi:hypothetical protein